MEPELAFALVKAGSWPFPVSPRNSLITFNLCLLEGSNSHLWPQTQSYPDGQLLSDGAAGTQIPLVLAIPE